MAVILLTGSLFAQTPNLVKQVRPTNNITQLMNTRTADTITTYLDRSSNFYIYGVQGGGYIFGNNGYYTETAMNYDAVANASLTDVILMVGAKYAANGTDLTVNAYAATNDTTPGALLGSTTFPMASIDTSSATAGMNTIHFASPVDLGGNPFFVGINLTSSDTIGVICNDPTSNDGQGEKRSVLNYGGAWVSVDYLFGGFDADGMYIPIVDISTGANYMESEGLKVMRVYPNPAKDYATINYAIDKTQNVKVKVFDITGKTILQKEEYQVEGNHQVKVNLSNLPVGNYYYTIQTQATRLTSKIVHVK